MDLFRSDPIAQPLAARLRSTNLDEYVGQEHLLARGKPLREALEQGALHSMIFWGPPGVGKTTLARLLAKVSDAHFETVSAVLAGVKEIRQAVDVAVQISSGDQVPSAAEAETTLRLDKLFKDAVRKQ